MPGGVLKVCTVPRGVPLWVIPPPPSSASRCGYSLLLCPVDSIEVPRCVPLWVFRVLSRGGVYPPVCCPIGGFMSREVSQKEVYVPGGVPEGGFLSLFHTEGELDINVVNLSH